MRVDLSDLLRLRSEGEAVLRELSQPVVETAQSIASQAALTVPRGGAPSDPLNLAETAFTSPPEYNLSRRLSVTAFTGYTHPRAGEVHEGYHWGEQTKTPPPHWLRKAAKRGQRSRLIKGVAARLQAALAKYFPKK